jgi:predicted kinase
LFPTPSPPDWRIDDGALEKACPWLHDLAGCEQEPTHHAEGDVRTHTLLAARALADLPGFRALPEEDRAVLFAAVLLHDVGKPACTRRDLDGTITSRGHARKGAILARGILWRLGVPLALRERVCGLVRRHLVPFFLIDQADPERKAIECTETARASHLALLAEADARVCSDLPRLLENVALFVETCRELGCLDQPFAFPTDHTRFVYLRSTNRPPSVPVHDDSRSELVLLSGLPGAGKDTWLRENLPSLPVVSLDDVREELDVSPEDEQGSVIQHARELAREHLRAGRTFAWNATNVSRALRAQTIALAASYGARVRVVSIEASEPTVLARNRARERRVPESVIERLVARWEIPDRTEAHTVDWVSTG